MEIFLFLGFEANVIEDSLDEINFKIECFLKFYKNLRMGYCFYNNEGYFYATDLYDYLKPKIKRSDLKHVEKRSAIDEISCQYTKETFFKILCHIGYELNSYDEESKRFQIKENLEKAFKSFTGPSINQLTDFFGDQFFNDLISQFVPKFLTNFTMYNLIRLNLKNAKELNAFKIKSLQRESIPKSNILHCLSLELKFFKRFDLKEVHYQDNSTDDLIFELVNMNMKNFKFTKNSWDVTNFSTLYEFSYKYLNKYIYFLHHKYWLENIQDLHVCRNILDIYSTTKYFANEFNSKYHCKIKVAETFLITNEQLFFLVKEVDQNISNCDLKFSNTFEILEAFTHFTYIASNQNLVIFDLRSFQIKEIWCNQTLLLTEPVIFSICEKRFSSSNLGPKGLEWIVNRHRCNSICDNLCLKKID